MASIIGTGIREALMWAGNEGKLVTIYLSGVSVTGKVLKVIPLVLEQADQTTAVINLDAVDMVLILQAPSQKIVQAVSPQVETRFMGSGR
jgi:hypothetical protein